jgi:crossover junction endodeoxyribonuclease RuvC
MIFIGIDPGLTGAIVAIHDSRKVIGVWDTPTLRNERNGSVRHEPDRAEMASLVREILRCRDQLGEPFACIERVNAMPGQGVTSSFSFGMGYGVWLGILATLRVPVDLVHPVRWKKTLLADMGKEKDASMIRVKELFPECASLFTLKKHHGRADALLIAEYRRRLE